MDSKIKRFGFKTDSLTKVNKKHKKSYNVWRNIIMRCYDKTNKAYKRYGGKGVVVCEEWRLYSNFEKWYDENYIEGYEIDKDINGGNIYSPDNCIFVSKRENVIEGISRRDNGYMKNRRGSKNSNSKSKEYYSVYPKRRFEFKNICLNQGWNFDDFEEIDSGIRYARSKKYYYIYRETI